MNIWWLDHVGSGPCEVRCIHHNCCINGWNWRKKIDAAYHGLLIIKCHHYEVRRSSCRRHVCFVRRRHLSQPKKRPLDGPMILAFLKVRHQTATTVNVNAHNTKTVTPAPLRFVPMAAKQVDLLQQVRASYCVNKLWLTVMQPTHCENPFSEAWLIPLSLFCFYFYFFFQIFRRADKNGK